MVFRARRAGGQSHRPSSEGRRITDESRASVQALDASLAKLEDILEVGDDGKLYLKFANARKFEFSANHFKGRGYHLTEHGFAYTGTTKVYASFVSSSYSATITNMVWLVPMDGSLVKVIIASAGAAGSTVVGVHKDGNTTAEEEHTVTLAAWAEQEIVFSDNKFAARDAAHISVTPASNGTSYAISCVWRLDSRTL